MEKRKNRVTEQAAGTKVMMAGFSLVGQHDRGKATEEDVSCDMKKERDQERKVSDWLSVVCECFTK